jgi:hypothetical protein
MPLNDGFWFHIEYLLNPETLLNPSRILLFYFTFYFLKNGDGIRTDQTVRDIYTTLMRATAAPMRTE